MIEVFYVVIGVVLLFAGGEFLLRGSVSLAHSFKVSRLLISGVIIGFGTSMPDLTVSVGAAIKDSPDIALGNVIGSNIANILLIIGVSALVRPIHVVGESINRNIFCMLLSAIILFVLMWFNSLNFKFGIVFLVVLAAYVLWFFREDHKHYKKQNSNGAVLVKTYKPAIALMISVLGIACLVLGSSVMVESAMFIARIYGISEAVMGLTLVAVGSSLPELATAIISAIRRHSDVVLGNVVGSSIFNVLGILGVTLLVQPIDVCMKKLGVDIGVMLLSSIILSVLVKKRITIGRGAALAMLISYICYLSFLYGLLNF